MSKIELVQLENAIARVEVPSCDVAFSLNVSPKPDPYIPPTFHIEDGQLPAEVICIKAPAAVGKSVTAQYLSASRNALFLNLAEVAVGDGSLPGQLAPKGQKAFHRGELPIVVDALDEGRLLSKEPAFESFLESTVKFLRKDRTFPNRAKLILLGREDSADFSKLAIQVEDEGIEICTLRLDFFEKDAASDLISLYARKELIRLHQNNKISEQELRRRQDQLTSPPMNELKDAYFSAIESALGVELNNLWNDDRGRTFAGYAPVLASLGTLLASITNPMMVTQRLRGSGMREAWEVIDTVIQEILERERNDKLVPQLVHVKAIPENSYDSYEQLTYLAQLINGQRQITLTGRVAFKDEKDTNTYLEKVQQICTEHPFIRDREIANDVLGSTILAHVVCNGVGGLDGDGGYISLLKKLSRGPFLWRSVKRELSNHDDPLLDGRYIGYIVNSYWNDPMENSGRLLKISELDDTSMVVNIDFEGTNQVTFKAVAPLTIYERLRNCEIMVKEGLVVEGASIGNSDSLFRFQDKNKVTCGSLEYRAKSTDINGSLWLAANEFTLMHTGDHDLRINGTYGWGGDIRKKRPWNQFTEETETNPNVRSKLADMFEECQQKIMPTGIILLEDYSISEDEQQVLWPKKYGAVFSSLVKLLVSEGFADRVVMGGVKKPAIKYRIFFSKTPWRGLRNACEEGTGVDQQVQDLLEKIRRIEGMKD